MKFEFQSQDEEEGTFVCHQFEAGTWFGALDQFVKFLRGSGYQLKDNSVGINEAAGHLFLEEFCFSNITTFDSSEVAT